MRRFSLAALGTSTADRVFIINTDCEETGTPTGWTNSTGSPNWDYSAVPLNGAQSVYMATAAASVRARIDFSNLTEVWVYFKLRFTNGSLPAGNVNFMAISANGSAASTITLALTAAGRLSYATMSPTASLTTPDVTYHIWLYYKQGSGADSAGSIGFSTTGVRPTSGTSFLSTTTGSLTNLAGRLWFGPSASTLGYDCIFDDIKVADTQIGDNGT